LTKHFKPHNRRLRRLLLLRLPAPQLREINDDLDSVLHKYDESRVVSESERRGGVYTPAENLARGAYDNLGGTAKRTPRFASLAANNPRF
jgi:hypothetical protein